LRTRYENYEINASRTFPTKEWEIYQMEGIECDNFREYVSKKSPSFREEMNCKKVVNFEGKIKQYRGP